MFDFTTEQVEFLESSGKVVLHACPGSGKTTIVARKLANYLQCWNRPHQGIAVLSFTNVASDEIRHQATEMLPEGYCVDDPHFIGTLDSFIDNFIFLRFGYLLQKKPKRPVITSPDVVNSYQFWRKSCYTNCLSHIGDFRWNSNGKLTKNGKDIICTGTQQYAPPCIQFKKRLLEKGLFFQDEVSGLACILLERYPEIAKSIALRFPVIILDEAQDTSEEQMRILDLLCAAGLESMYIVGDPDQAIYEWRNANPESFLEKMHDSESQIIQYAKWKQVVIEILIRLPSADEGCGQWVTNSRDIVHKILVSHNVAMRDGITMNDAIKIKTRDKKHPDFRKIPIRCYFEIKSKAEYVQASELSFRCHSFSPK